MGLGRISNTVASILWILLILLVASEGRLFKVLDKDGNVCGLIEVNFTVTITALQGGKKLRAVNYDQDFYRNFISGNCNRNMTLHFDNIAAWNFHVHFKLIPDPKYMLTRSVSFKPWSVFGKTAPSNKTEVFVNTDDSEIGPVDCSYKCGIQDRTFYKKMNSSIGEMSGIKENDITYSVLVDVRYIQFQASHVHREKFGPPVICRPPAKFHNT